MKQPKSKPKYYGLNCNTSVSFHFYLSRTSAFNTFTFISKGHRYTLFAQNQDGRKKIEIEKSWDTHTHTHTHSLAVCGRGMKRRREEAQKPNLTPACQPVVSYCCTSSPLLIIDSLLWSKPRCFCQKPQPLRYSHIGSEQKGCTRPKWSKNIFFPLIAQAKNQMQVRKMHAEYIYL